MTVRRKPDPQNPEKDSFDVKLGSGTISWRAVLFIAVVSMHPYGQQALTALGFPVPKASAVSVAADVATLQEHAHTIESQVAEVRSDVAAVKQDVKLVKNQITAFEVNFDKYKKDQP
jgi:hypothetical protein